MRVASIVLGLVCAGCFLPELEQAPEPVDSDACLSCAASDCADDSQRCFANPACETLMTCALHCADGDSLCLTSCAQESPMGVDDAVALGECTDASCSSACPAFDLAAP
jgi:hypothetical protein